MDIQPILSNHQNHILPITGKNVVEKSRKKRLTLFSCSKDLLVLTWNRKKILAQVPNTITESSFYWEVVGKMRKAKVEHMQIPVP